MNIEQHRVKLINMKGAYKLETYNAEILCNGAMIVIIITIKKEYLYIPNFTAAFLSWQIISVTSFLPIESGCVSLHELRVRYAR